MKRRQIIQYTGASLLTTTATLFSSKLVASPNKPKPKSDNYLLVQWLGHTCFFLTEPNGLRILINPFRSIGCTKGYPLPRVEADLVLISSQLWDEGAVEGLPGNPKVLFEAGNYDIKGFRLQGVEIAHDRKGGRQFGMNVAWRWNQGGLKIVHLGGAAAAIELEQKILLGSPDLAFIPVGGGAKAYNPEEAKEALTILNPKVMIPTQYLTDAADQSNCDLSKVDEFLKLVSGMNIRQIEDNKLRLKVTDLPPKGTLIRVFSDSPLLSKPTEKK